MEGEFYKAIDQDLQKGLTNIYKETNLVKNEVGSGVSMDKKRDGRAFSEASQQLAAILQTKEKQSRILWEWCKKQMSLQAKAGQKLKFLKEGGAE